MIGKLISLGALIVAGMVAISLGVEPEMVKWTAQGMGFLILVTGNGR